MPNPVLMTLPPIPWPKSRSSQKTTALFTQKPGRQSDPAGPSVPHIKSISDLCPLPLKQLSNPPFPSAPGVPAWVFYCLSLQNHFHSPHLVSLINPISSYSPDINYPQAEVIIKKCKSGQATPLVKVLSMLSNNTPEICDFVLWKCSLENRV